MDDNIAGNYWGWWGGGGGGEGHYHLPHVQMALKELFMMMISIQSVSSIKFFSCEIVQASYQ